ncbi:MAG: hypothetical protein A2X64_01955 [Ignavibacteria bacterium GWF2_33_9]|nr:MAG: hypothetical protein A2X64_01955 [Ignavibacteria bacterium GWF2_33_9]
MKIIAIIPSRISSIRLPRKPLADICGKPMIQWVYEAVSSAKFIDNVIIATDSQEIMDECKSFGADCILTSPDLPSGTDRIHSAYKLSNQDADIILNVQGDEPFIQSQMLDDFLAYISGKDFDVATVVTKIQDNEDIFNPSVVKAVLAENNYALYFSRSPIPYLRDIPQEKWVNNATYWKHIGIYAYKTHSLNRFVGLPQSNLEKIEKLEQLRLMEDEAKYICFETSYELLAIDTPKDLEKARVKMGKIRK